MSQQFLSLGPRPGPGSRIGHTDRLRHTTQLPKGGQQRSQFQIASWTPASSVALKIIARLLRRLALLAPTIQRHAYSTQWRCKSRLSLSLFFFGHSQHDTSQHVSVTLKLGWPLKLVFLRIRRPKASLGRTLAMLFARLLLPRTPDSHLSNQVSLFPRWRRLLQVLLSYSSLPYVVQSRWPHNKQSKPHRTGSRTRKRGRDIEFCSFISRETIAPRVSLG